MTRGRARGGAQGSRLDVTDCLGDHICTVSVVNDNFAASVITLDVGMKLDPQGPHNHHH